MFRRRRLAVFSVIMVYVGMAFLLASYFFRDVSLFRFFPIETFFTIGGVLVTGGMLLFVANYLGILDSLGGDAPFGVTQVISDPEIRALIVKFEQKIDAIATAQHQQSVATAIIDDTAKAAIVSALTEEAKGALSAFVEKEVFKKATESDEKERKFHEISNDFNSVISEYKGQMASWGQNANVNLFIGLACAIGGILLMWQILISIQWGTANDGTVHWGDAYRFIARFGLVILVESVAFFFLKLYREDRGMIRYLRNEITNLEARSLALKTALTFTRSETLAKVVLGLVSTERNFILKKGERVLTDLVYENSEMLFEKMLGRKQEAMHRKGDGGRQSNLDDRQQ